MDGPALFSPRTSAAMHVTAFLLIVVGSAGALAYLTGTSRLALSAGDVSKPIPELARWSVATEP